MRSPRRGREAGRMVGRFAVPKLPMKEDAMATGGMRAGGKRNETVRGTLGRLRGDEIDRLRPTEPVVPCPAPASVECGNALRQTTEEICALQGPGRTRDGCVGGGLPGGGRGRAFF